MFSLFISNFKAWNVIYGKDSNFKKDTFFSKMYKKRQNFLKTKAGLKWAQKVIKWVHYDRSIDFYITFIKVESNTLRINHKGLRTLVCNMLNIKNIFLINFRCSFHYFKWIFKYRVTSINSPSQKCVIPKEKAMLCLLYFVITIF